MPKEEVWLIALLEFLNTTDTETGNVFVVILKTWGVFSLLISNPSLPYGH